MPSYLDVKAQIAKLEKQAQDLFKKEVATVIAKIQGLMQEYGLTPDDIAGRVKAFKDYKAPNSTKKVKTSKPAVIPKYRDPVSGKTWTGHGKAPAWIAAAVKAGTKEDYLIGKVAKPVKPVKAAPKSVTTKAALKPAAKVAKKAVAKPAVKPVAKKPAPKSAAPNAAPAKSVVKKPAPKVSAPKVSPPPSAPVKVAVKKAVANKATAKPAPTTAA
jgi:DNA-binding protein H-NS